MVCITVRVKSANLIKELLCSTQYVLELCQFEKVLLQCFLVSVDLLQFILQLLKGCLQIKSRHTINCGFIYKIFYFVMAQRKELSPHSEEVASSMGGILKIIIGG